MNYKKIGVICCSVLVAIYALFLILPFIVSPIANKYTKNIENFIKDSSGFDIKISGFGVTTSPNFAVGIKAKEITVSVSDDKAPFFKAENAGGDIKLLPLILKKVEFGKIYAKNLDGSLIVKKDGTFLVQDYLPENQDEESVAISLPYGLKLSNHLPNIKVNNYKFAFKDATDNKSYYIQGENFKITDFILDKKIKLSMKGKLIFDDTVISNYDVKISNKIMPNLNLDDIVFPKQAVVQQTDNMPSKANPSDYTIIDIFKLIKRNQMRADVNADIKVSGSFKNPVQQGYLGLERITVAVNGRKLPESYAKLHFKGKKTDIDSILFTSADENEKTQIIGSIKSGSKPSIDLALKSNAKFNNVIRLADSIAQSFGINDLKTITATGGIDANFNINSNLKKVSSTGYLKINPSSLTYGLYNIIIDKITADIDFMNNNINIKNAGFSVLGHPLKLVGTITQDAVADLKLTADKLSVKGLLGALGQASLLKDNQINSGTISLNTIIKGKLDSLNPDINVTADNINILNKPANAKLLLSNALVKLLIDNNKINGDIDINNLALKLDGASISVPKGKIVADSKDINIKDSYVLINNSKVNASGSVKDYTTDKLNMNIKASGNLASADIMTFMPSDIRSMFPYKGAMPMEITVTGNAKTQDICFKLTADPSNYITFADINILKGKTTKIHTDIKISGNSLTFSDSGIYAGESQIAIITGGVDNLSNPNLNIGINVPQNVSFPIPGLANSNLTGNGNVNITGGLDNPRVKGKVTIPDISIKDMNFTLTDTVLNFNGSGIGGSATAKSIKMDNLKANDITSKFALTDFNNFYLSDISGTAFGGKVTGLLSYNIASTGINLDFSGKGLNSTDAVYAVSGIQKALTGLLDFGAKITTLGVTDVDIIKNMKGKVTFEITNGNFLSIGKLENLVNAQNITSNSLLKSAVSALSTLTTAQQTDKFDSINGEISLGNGLANISSIKVAGKMMSYYIKGSYDILKNTAYMVILGRLDSKTVGALGPFGQLSADKILGVIPKFGTATAQFLNLITQDPANEDVSLIPALTSGSTSYSEFKVIFNGPVEKSSSMKSFKWLSKGEIEKVDVKQEAKNAVENVKTNIESQVNSAKTTVENVKTNTTNIINAQKQNIETQKQAVQQTVNDIKNLKQNLGKMLLNKGNNNTETTQEQPAETSADDSEN